MALPVINAVVDDFTAGIGSLVMQVTGINDAIESGFEKLDNVQLTSEYQSDRTETDPAMYDKISDPRLDQWFSTVKNTVKNNATTFWNKHDTAKELGHVIEFRSGLDIAYRKKNGGRIGAEVHHLSNASLDENNPGTCRFKNYQFNTDIDDLYAPTGGNQGGNQTTRLPFLCTALECPEGTNTRDECKLYSQPH